MRDQQWALLLAALTVFSSGCRKDKDENPPEVRILAPTNAHSITVPETINVRVEVSDENTVEGVVLSIVDAQGVAIAASASVQVNAASAVVDLSLAVTNERIITGQYTIVARATDGQNDGRAFLDVLVNAAPLRLRSIFILPRPSDPGPFMVTRIDSTGTLSTWTVLSELGGAAIDADRIYTAGSASQPVKQWTFDPVLATTLFPNQNPAGVGEPYFYGTAIDPADGALYFGTRDGSIRGFGSQGSQTFTATTISGSRSTLTTVVGDKLASHVITPSTGERKLLTYAHSSGALLAQFQSDVEAIGAFRRTDQWQLVFGNRNGDGAILERNVDLGGTIEVLTLSGDPIRKAIRLNESTYLLGLATGLARFSQPGNMLSTIAPGLVVDALAFDPTSGHVFTGSGDQLLEVDPSSGAVITARTMPTAIGHILPLFNR